MIDQVFLFVLCASLLHARPFCVLPKASCRISWFLAGSSGHENSSMSPLRECLCRPGEIARVAPALRARSWAVGLVGSPGGPCPRRALEVRRLPAAPPAAPGVPLDRGARAADPASNARTRRSSVAGWQAGCSAGGRRGVQCAAIFEACSARRELRQRAGGMMLDSRRLQGRFSPCGVYRPLA